MARRVLVVALAVAVLLGIVLGGRVLWERDHRTDLEKAIRLVPAATKRLSFTDWAAVRTRLESRPGADPSAAAVGHLIGRAYDSDLSAASSIDDSAVALQTHYGFSPANADWEAYAQSGQGATMVLAMPSSVDFGLLARQLGELGYGRPAKDTGVWTGGADLVAKIDPSLTPELQYVVLLKDRHLVVTSDTASYAASSAAVASGHGEALDSVAGVDDMAGRVGEPAAALMWTRDFACADLAMSQADEASQRQADQLVARAGGVTALTGLTMAMAPDRRLTVAEEFADGDQARANLRPRAKLAVGPAPGRGDSFSDDFRLTGSRAEGSTVLLTLTPRASTGYVLSSLYDGPVLLATC